MYKWKYHLQTDPNIVGQEFEAIERENGELTREAVVDRARPENAPLHPLFQWDDAVAAEEYRKEQAHKLICNLVIVKARNEPEKPPITYRAFVNTNESSTTRGRYMNIQAVTENPETHRILLENAKRELRTFMQKYETLQELTELMTIIDEFTKGGKLTCVN